MLEVPGQPVNAAEYTDKKPEPKKPAPPVNPALNNNRPFGLYNGSIAPLVPYGIRGAIWYQGESNNGRPREYETLFPAIPPQRRGRRVSTDGAARPMPKP